MTVRKAKTDKDVNSIEYWSDEQREALIHLTLTDEEFGKHFIQGIQESTGEGCNMFSNEAHRLLMNLILESYSKTKTIPTREKLELLVKEKVGNDSIRLEITTSIIDRMYSNVFPEDALDEIRKNRVLWLRNNLLLKVSNEIQEMLGKLTNSDTKDYFSIAMEKLVEYDRLSDFEKTCSEAVTTGSLFNDLKNNKVEIVPTNSKFINEMLGGGIRKKEICVFGMSSGSGKSCISSGMATWVANLNYKVVHIVLEDLDTSIKAKYASALLQVPASKIEENVEQYAEMFNTERFRNFENKLNSNLRTIYAAKNSKTDFETAEFSIERIDKELTKLKYEGFKPDLVIIDYYDRLVYNTSNKLMEGNESYLAGKIMSKIDILAKKWNVAVFIPSQLTKEGDTLPIEQLSGLYISGGKKKKDFCQSMFIMRNNPKSSDYDDKVILVAKNRHHLGTGDVYKVRFNNGTCLFDNKYGYEPYNDVENAVSESDEYRNKVAKQVKQGYNE